MKIIIAKLFVLAFGGGLILYGALGSIDILFVTGPKLERSELVEPGVMYVPALIGAGIALVGLVLLLGGWKRIKRFEKLERDFRLKTFDWYKRTYPHLITNGEIQCFGCGGGKLQVRALMQHTYHREHFCPQCGTTLYYSPECNS
ncbi:hypothetical protein [Oceanobacter mangrovi]|uniref:hypothetical protein n=1 Tax=Oceanobacter mangrovi TaxID=2862510 RepID=UPI001C8D22EC|nr:hypothetical protein [Oceanobacter mangrovi]